MIGVGTEFEYLKFSFSLFHDLGFLLDGVFAFKGEGNILIRKYLHKGVIEDKLIIFDLKLDFGVIFLQ